MRADDRSSAVISRGIEHLTDTSTPSDLTHAADGLPIRGSAAGRKKKMLREGDLVRVRNQRRYSDIGLGLVLAIESQEAAIHHLREVEVLIGEVHWKFMMYELEKV